MKRIIFILTISLFTTLKAFSACFFACTDPNEDGVGTEYLVETNDQTGAVVSVTATGNNCLLGPWVRPCAIAPSGPYDEEYTATLTRIDLKNRRTPTREEKEYLENLLRTPKMPIYADGNALSPEILAMLKGK